MNARVPSARACLILALLQGAAWTAAAADADPGQLEQQIKSMQQQIDALQSQLAAVAARNEASPATASVGGVAANLSLGGYGEVYYERPLHVPALAQADLARAVFGIGYQFDARTVFDSEFEVEHAVASAADRGEFEVEQFYVDHQLASWASIEGGLFLMPVGLLNEHHEPTHFYGVQRNFVETLIVPSTWREGGLAAHGNTDSGLGWSIGLTTGLDLGNWNVNPEAPLYRTALDLEDSAAAPMQQGHQELQLANAQHLSQFLSLNYHGIPGLLAGAALFTGNAAVATVPAGLPQQRVTLWEGHVRWTPGAFDLSALYARGHFGNTAAFNLANAGASEPMPAEFLGYYAQGAYTLWQHGDYRFAPFARWEHYDMGARYEGIAAGFSTVPTGVAADGKPWPRPRDFVWSGGANFYLDPHVVLKTDYQWFDVNRDFTRVELGIGLDF